jgi:hypothetical protein
VRELTPIQRDLEHLAAELKKLEAEYSMFFAGRLPRPPWETRGRVEAIIKRWDRGYIETAVDRFRFTTLQTRFSKFVDLWDRGLRAREEGRPGPFASRQATESKPKDGKAEAGGLRPTRVTFTDPTQETDKLQDLYEAVMDARRQVGQEVVPFHRFARLVTDQVKKLRKAGEAEVTFRVDRKGDQIVFTARGAKGEKS